MNDRGNALRLAWFLRDKVRWAGEAVGWLFWSATHWARGGLVESQVRELVARHMARLALAVLSKIPDVEKGKLRTFVSKCGSTAWRRNAIADLRDVSAIRIDAILLDSAPYLLTVENGTVDLRTRKLQPHRPEDLITHFVDTAYVPGAPAPRLRRFLDEVTRGNEQTVAFLHRAIGFVLVGEGTRKTKAFFFLYGPPDSGKGTLILVVTEILGPTLVGGLSWGALASATSGGPNSELAQLDGKRLATIPDSGSNPRWDAETLKKLTGGDHVTCSEKNKPARSYYPKATLVIAANDRPVVRGAGREAILQRLHIVPFRQSFSTDSRKIALGRALPAEDGLKDYLLEKEREGILAWFIEGASVYCRDGLGTCPEVDGERAGWADDDEDYLTALLAECAVTTRDEDPPANIAGQKITAQDLHHALRRWLDEQGLDADAVARFVGPVGKVSSAFNKLIDTDTRFGDVRKGQKSEVLAAGHAQRGERRRAWGGIAWNEAGLALLARGAE